VWAGSRDRYFETPNTAQAIQGQVGYDKLTIEWRAPPKFAGVSTFDHPRHAGAEEGIPRADRHQCHIERYDGVLIRLTTAPGTMDQLMNIGVAGNVGTSRLFPNLPAAAKGWTQNNAMLKLEGTVVNTGLGRGEALSVFNQNIVRFDRM
jgi:hypothetical protein